MAQRSTFSQTQAIVDPTGDVIRVLSRLRELLTAKDPQSGTRQLTETRTVPAVNIPDAATTADSVNFISLAVADAETIVKCLERFSFLQNSRAEIALQLVESRQALSRCRLEKAAVQKRLADAENSLRRTPVGNTFQGSAAETERTLRRVSLTDPQSLQQQQQHIAVRQRTAARDPLRFSTPAGCTRTRPPGTISPSDELRASLSIPLPVTIGALPCAGLEMDTVHEVMTSSAAATGSTSEKSVAEVSMQHFDQCGYVESLSTEPDPVLPTGLLMSYVRTTSGLTSTESSATSPQSCVVSLTPFLTSRNVSNRKSKPDETSASAAASGSGCDVAVSRDLVDKLTQQNQRLKRTLRQLVSNKYGSVDNYLTMQEYEDVIGQLRDDNKLLSTLNGTLRDLIRARNEGNVDSLTQKCLQLTDKMSVLEKSISVKETLLNALCKQKQQPRDLSATQQQRLQSEDERVNQLLVDFVKLKQKYAESTDKYRQQIELLQRQISRQAASHRQQMEPHFSVAEVGEDVACSSNFPAKTQSPDIDITSVDIIRPPPTHLSPPSVNVTSPASYGVAASGGTQLPQQPNDAVLTCPRCEREFAAHEDQLFITHCVRCIDD